MGDKSVLINLYQKVKGVSIFDLRAYIEPTHTMNASTLWSMLTMIFVNLPFAILNVIVGFISIVLRFFEDFSLYDTYKRTVYDSSKQLWQQLSGNGNYTTSLLYIVIALTALAIFVAYIFTKGDVGQRLLRLIVVMLLGLGYFGTIQNTSGGLYVLDSIHNAANSASEAISKVTIADPEDKNQKIDSQMSVADNYIAKTSYAAYLYVNTGRLDGKYYDNQTGELADFDDSKILGTVDSQGNFHKADTNERDEKRSGYLDMLGNDADKGKEKNRWVSAVFDYIFIKSFYVLFKILEAIIIGIPLLMIQMLKFLAELVVIFTMVGFPLALLAALFPFSEHIVYNFIKLMLGSSIFPALTGFLTLMVFYIEALIGKFVSDGFEKDGTVDLSSFGDYLPLFELIISTVLQCIVFIAIWKYKETLLSLIVGNRNARTVSKLASSVNDVGRRLSANAYDKAGDLAYSGAYALGAGAGMALSAKDGFDYLMSKGGKKEFGTHTGPMEGQVYDKADSDEDYYPTVQDERLLDGFDNDIFDEQESISDDMTNVDNQETVSDPNFVLKDDDKTYGDSNYNADPYNDSTYQEQATFREDNLYSDDYLGDFEDNYNANDISDDNIYEDYSRFDDLKANTYQDNYSESYQDVNGSYQEGYPNFDEPLEEKTYDFEDNDQRDNRISSQRSRKTDFEPADTNVPFSETFSDNHKNYKKEKKLKKELSEYRSMDDLTRLKADSPFKRGMAKMTSRKRQYKTNVKRVTKIEQELARLRGDVK